MGSGRHDLQTGTRESRARTRNTHRSRPWNMAFFLMATKKKMSILLLEEGGEREGGTHTHKWGGGTAKEFMQRYRTVYEGRSTHLYMFSVGTKQTNNGNVYDTDKDENAIS